eukprot:5952023-Pleurochrysis_carterae.AAC.2
MHAAIASRRRREIGSGVGNYDDTEGNTSKYQNSAVVVMNTLHAKHVVGEPRPQLQVLARKSYSLP